MPKDIYNQPLCMPCSQPSSALEQSDEIHVISHPQIWNISLQDLIDGKPCEFRDGLNGRCKPESTGYEQEQRKIAEIYRDIVATLAYEYHSGRVLVDNTLKNQKDNYDKLNSLIESTSKSIADLQKLQVSNKEITIDLQNQINILTKHLEDASELANTLQGQTDVLQEQLNVDTSEFTEMLQANYIEDENEKKLIEDLEIQLLDLEMKEKTEIDQHKNVT